MSIELRLQIINAKTGEVEYDEPSHSFVLQFMQLLCLQMKNAAYVGNIKDITNTNRTGALLDTTYHMIINAVGGTDDYGIVVGSGVGAEAVTDYKLDTLITHGVGLGQLKYGSQVAVELVNNAGVMRIELSRMVSNGSGGDVDINEVGLYLAQDATPHYFCGIRDVLGAPLTVADGASKIIQYVFTATN